MYECSQNLALLITMCTVVLRLVPMYVHTILLYWLLIVITMKMDVATWSRTTARPGDPPQGQVWSMCCQHIMLHASPIQASRPAYHMHAVTINTMSNSLAKRCQIKRIGQ